jgi:hypothetical protein
MSETYDFPDSEDIPKIQTTTEEPFTRPESKRLFIQYDSDEWESEEDANRVIETINWLFGSDVQIAVLPKDFDLLSDDEVEQMVEDVING